MAFDNIRLEKGMYREGGKSFTQVLEALDPSEAYKGTAMEGTDAFQRQLKRFGIRVKGAGSDPVEKFFSTMDSAVLFPEYVARTVRAGMDEQDVLSAIVATTTKIDSLDYRSVYTDMDNDDKMLARVAQGAQVPATSIKSKENLVHLNKRGRMLVASYEALRFQKLDLFSVVLRQIGAYIRKMHTEDAIGVLTAGDGNNNPAESFSLDTSEIPSTTLDYDALLRFWAQFRDYELNTMLCDAETTCKLLQIKEFQNPQAGLNFQGTGKLSTPIGAQLLRVEQTPVDTIIGLDRRCALEMVCAGDVLVEYDKLIDRQLERAAISSIAGFCKIYDGAVKLLNV